jgi:hypothetical protein
MQGLHLGEYPTLGGGGFSQYHLGEKYEKGKRKRENARQKKERGKRRKKKRK